MPTTTRTIEFNEQDIECLIARYTQLLTQKYATHHLRATAKERLDYWTGIKALLTEPAPPPPKPPEPIIHFATPPPPTPRPKHKQLDPVRASTSDVYEAMHNKREQELGPVPIFCYECHHHAPCPHIKVKASSF